MDGKKITIKLWRFGKELVGFIQEQCPYIKRGDGTLFTSANGFRISSMCSPQLSSHTLHIRGTAKGADFNYLHYEAGDADEAKQMARKAKEAVNGFNKQVQEVSKGDCEVVL